MIAGFMFVRARVMIDIVIVPVMVVGMGRVDQPSLFEQRMRCDGRPNGGQKQREHASHKPHPGSVVKVFAFATLEMDLALRKAMAGRGFKQAIPFFAR